MPYTKAIHFTGHSTFLNRGCEAIVRGTLEAFQQYKSNYTFSVPSRTVSYDSHIIDSLPESTLIKYRRPIRANALQRISRYTGRQVPVSTKPLRPPREIRDSIMNSRSVFSIGGDNYSLDYGFPLEILGLDSYALSLRKPTVLWGASAGPFPKSSAITSAVTKHLSKFHAVFLRENLSYSYLHDLGLRNIYRMPDPAFFMTEGVVPRSLSFIRDEQWVGLNLSLLVFERSVQLKSDLEPFITWMTWLEREVGLRSLLIPHVVPQIWGYRNNDMFVLKRLFKMATQRGLSPILVPGVLTAPEYKAIIGHCDAMIGARTHSTIAAWSSGIPCAAISYSVKARGLCEDLFGNEDFVIPKGSISSDLLIAMTTRLLEDRESICNRLRARNKEYHSLMSNALDIALS